MTHTKKRALALILSVLVCAAALSALAATPDDIAATFARHILEGRYDEAFAMMSDEVAAQVTALGGMEAFLSTVTAQTGEITDIGGVRRGGEQAGLTGYTASLTAANGRFVLHLSIDKDGKVAGVAVVPAAEDPIALPKGYSEKSVTIDAGTGYPLSGRLVKPTSAKKSVPLVVLVQGSGATDYDEIVGVNRVFGKLAAGLAKQGIATLRYDKRNYTYPEIMQQQGYTVQQEYVEDVLAAVKFAQAQQGVSRVFILGHSQGGMLAPLFVEAGADVSGMILLAGTPRSLLDVATDQQNDIIAYYEANGLAEQAAQISAQQAVWNKEREALKAMTPEQAQQAGTVFEFPAYYIYDLEQYDAIATIKSLRKPTLVLQGGNDMQVYADKDFAQYKSALKGEKYVTTKLYSGLSHIFLKSKAKNLVEATAEYNTKGDIPAQVFRDIAKWVKKTK